THRFGTERLMEKVAEPIARLESLLRAGGQGIEELLSINFRGAAVVPASDTSLREDSASKLRRCHWNEEQESGLSAAEFAATLRHFLVSHAPLDLADLACLSISSSSSDHPTTARTRLRFELGVILSGRASPRWQAIGEWALEWAQTATGWKIAEWRPVEMT